MTLAIIIGAIFLSATTYWGFERLGRLCVWVRG